jgi:DNA excision repair protein ERCC-5
MGVTGLWELLLPVGRRVDSAHVSRKTVAVDVSIWLTQFARAMRDADGDMVRNAHLLGVLRRCCKLLFLGVRPVFVFDGETPALKRRTLMLRAAARDVQAARLRRQAEKLILSRLKEDLLARGLMDRRKGKRKGKGKGHGKGAAAEGVSKPPLMLPAAPPPPPPPASFMDAARATGQFLDRAADAAHPRLSVDAGAKSDSGTGAVGLELFDGDGGVYALGEGAADGGMEGDGSDSDPAGIALPDDIRELDEEALLNLPVTMQAAVFRQIKVSQRLRHREEVLGMQSDPASFSKAQIKGFLSNTALNKRIAAVRSAINDRSGASRRIASDSAREYVLEERVEEAEVLPAHRSRVSARSLAGNGGGDDEDYDDDEFEDDAGETNDGDEEETDILRKIRREQGGGRFALKPESLSGGRAPKQATRETAGVAWASRVLNNGGDHELEGKSQALSTGHHVLGGGENGAAFGRGGKPVSAAAKLRRLQSNFRGHDGDDDDDADDEDIDGGEWEMHVLPNPGGAGAVAGTTGHSDSDDMDWEDGAAPQPSDFGGDGEDVNGLKIPLLRKVRSDEREKPPVMPDLRASSKVDVGRGGKQSLAKLQSTGLEAFAEVFGTSTSSRKVGNGDTVSAAEPETTARDSPTEIEPAMLECERQNKAVSLAVAENVIARDQGDCEGRATQAAIAASMRDMQQAGNGDAAASGRADEASRRGDFVDDQDLQAALRASVAEENLRVASALRALVAGEDAEDDDDDNDGGNDDVVEVSDADDDANSLKNLVGEQNGDVQVGNLEIVVAEKAENSSVPQLQSRNKDSTLVPVPSQIGESGSIDTPAKLDDSKSRHGSETPQTSEELVARAVSLDSDDLGAPEVIEQLTDEDIARLQKEIGAENASLGRETRSLRAATQSLSDEMYGETRDLLRLLGLPYLEAPMEAEAQCAYFNEIGLVDAVLTEDSDALLFGAKVVYRHLFANGKFAESYDAACVQSELGINRERFIKLALLLGSDYTPGVRGVGIVNAMEILQAFPGDDGLQKFKDWSRSVSLADKKPDDNELESEAEEAVRRRFCWKHRNMKRNWELFESFPSQVVVDAYMKPQVDKSDSPFTWHTVDVPGLAKFCYEKFAWRREKFDEVMGPVLKQQESFRNNGLTQTVIEDFFKPHRFAKIRSERLQAAVKGIAGDKAEPLLAGPRGTKRPPPKDHEPANLTGVAESKYRKRPKRGKSVGRRRFRGGGGEDGATLGGAVEEIGDNERDDDDDDDDDDGDNVEPHVPNNL